ncbi:serine/threonine phosphatase [Iningainema tapete]|uniref:Serine/threonine phosphatase n=1 Tax=Iningainema tapete BLCC-T55 TaxID=2748662 RepID=A0A8J7C5R9_9CYAN|nr:serine/threonine phosphatase [Iningainema tapete]MBD2773414.1 serine/threonine phosphatase [Iningainema tapete BLCC-T55]
MLICPRCSFENSDNNKFCQNCGNSLTHRDCPQCTTLVPVNVQLCHNCGAECGKFWWAIITGNPSRTNSPTQECYLDNNQRYQLLQALPPVDEASGEIEVRVLDCLPYQVSPLKTILAQQQSLMPQSIEANGIPHTAKPYIGLQTQCHQGIPPLHDAWEQDRVQVVLIEDRSDWQYLIDLWQEDKTTSLQIVHCLYQMTQLWIVLEKVNCCQSLLELSNLRLDEDGAVALQRLYVDSAPMPQSQEDEPPLTIKTLGRIWQALFRQSQRTQFGSIVQLLGEIEMDKIQTIAQLQSSLQLIASELQGIPKSTKADTPLEITTSAPTILQLEDTEGSGVKNDDMPTVVLPMQLISLENAGLTDVGRQRNHNEDYFGIENQINKLELPNSRSVQARGLFILCDGMGGHAGGEVASALAVNNLRQFFQTRWISNQLPTEAEIREAVKQANKAIYDLNQKDARSGVGRMGTTLVMLLLQDTHVAVAHVGDSRLYRFTRKRGLDQLTVDHEVGQREILRGVEPSEAYARQDAYQLTQALGPRDENFIIPDVQFFEINEDTLFILASDGLSDNDLLETNVQTHLEPLLNKNTHLESGVKDLIDLANTYNGHDNITAVLIRAKVRPNLEQQARG